MFKIFTRALDGILDRMRFSREEQRMMEHMLGNYEAQQKGMVREVLSKPVPIGDRSAMRLIAGNAYQIGHATYRVSIHDKNNGSRFDAPEAPFAAFGDTAAHARQRAEQLISALDGARRL